MIINVWRGNGPHLDQIESAMMPVVHGAGDGDCTCAPGFACHIQESEGKPCTSRF